MNEDIIKDIKELWGVHFIHYHDQYLGLPFFVERSKFHTFRDIKGKVCANYMDGKISYYHRLVVSY